MKTKKECRCNKPELEEQLMKMPELEKQFTDSQLEEEAYTGVISAEPDELIHKRMNDINTFQCCEGELYLRGTDEYGKDFQICFDAYDFINWIDTEYIKEQLINHIKTK